MCGLHRNDFVANGKLFRKVELHKWWHLVLCTYFFWFSDFVENSKPINQYQILFAVQQKR